MLKDKIPDIQDIEPDVDMQQPDENNYQFADGYIDPDDTLEEFLDDFRKPKEETGAAEMPEDDEIIPDEEDELSNETARYTAAFVVDVSDEIFAHALSFYSLNPVDEHRAGKEQKKHLKKLWTQYCKEKSWEIPIGTQIIIAMATIYASQLPKAYSDRKANLKLEQLKEDQERLAYDRRMFDMEKEMFNRKNKKEDTNDRE